ncbi:MAG TPA: DUF2059 domain-containing protein [Steroidobacteraceae bacterium]|nr:DUF2059 domain-containing protein [Steroidobacteraceae bacterium]
MKMRRSLAALAALLLVVSTNALAQGQAQDIPPAKRAAIEKLIEITGALNLGRQLSAAMVTQLTNALRATHADIPQKALDILPDVVNGVIAENMATLRETMMHLYDQHLTLEDVQGLNQFYSTPLGRKVIKDLPSLLQESIVAGQKWGQALGPEIARRLRERFQKEGIAL